MRILGLDISSKTGFALLDDGKLVEYGLLVAPAISDHSLFDLNILKRAKDSADQMESLIKRLNPDLIFVEQTNSGRFRVSQKGLEFTHCLFLLKILEQKYQDKMFYVDTSKWRSTLKIKLSKDDRDHNKKVRAKKIRGKITPKHLAVAWANENFSLELKLKDNDIADAICIAQFGVLNEKKISPASSISTDDVLS